ncbi:MAG TPA: serine/threonine-protein kinase [Ktedonobacteraceae bacterium]|nr:serine/threonine-protein kinase [Ktedonobacteraceae bacterium]
MNAEALVGKKLDSYTLRRVIGVGSMGAVYLARQSQSHHEYVLKVFLRASSLEPLQYIDFLLRFRQEMELISSLKHPHILSVLEYEERDGFVFLVMPYVSVRSLESILNSQKQLTLLEIADYLDQLAAALDYAHEQGILHLDIKPGNILITIQDKLLLTDFALTKTMTERQAATIRQFKVGMLDYMAPEQVMGKEPGEKVDLYSLGAVLYHMVTGSAPFKGETMVEVAKKHLQEAPPSPRLKRADLPLAAEQVILRALSKRPGHRYAHAQDLAVAFRLALETPSTELEQARKDVLLPSDVTSSGIYPSYSLFDPQWRAEFSSVKDSQPALDQSTPVLAGNVSNMPTGVFVSIKNLPQPTKPEPVAEKSPHPLHIVHFNPITPPQETRRYSEQITQPGNVMSATPVQDSWTAPGQNANPSRVLMVSNAITPVQDARVFPEQNTNPGALMLVPDAEQTTTGTIMKLTSPVKVVNVPVAGQPGHYMVGLLPVPEVSQPEKGEQPTAPGTTKYLKKNSKLIGLALLVILLFGTGALWFAHQHSSSKTPAAVTIVKTPDLKATVAARATATAEANIILSDPLTTNIHNWPLMASGSMLYVFKDAAYHITDNDNSRGAPAILSGLNLKGPFVYTLTMEEIKGDDTSVNNEFGMIFRATIQNKNGKTFTTFYTLEVLNKTGGEYQFWKYDDSQGAASNLWEKLASHPFGSEFHEGQGSKSINTFKIIANGKNFTLVVNGKKAWTFQDGSFATGGVGMLVNLKGTEVAFSNLLITHH